MALYLAAHDGDWSAFVCTGQERLGAPPFEALSVGFPLGGFDGQFYYALARDPWSCQPEALDLPAYRHARLLYPLLGWLLSGGGDPRALVVVLPLINLGAIGVLTQLCCRLARHCGRSSWWGLLLTLGLNTGMSALRDLTDPVATMAGVGLLAACLRRERSGWLLLWGVAAVFAREQNLVLLALLGLRDARDRRWRAVACHAAAVLLWFLWVLCLRQAYGTWPPEARNLDWPLCGMFWRWTHLTYPGGRVAGLVHVAGMSLLTIEVCLAAATIRGGRLPCALALLGAALAVLASESVYLNGWSYNRAFTFLPLGIGLWALRTNRLWPLCVVSAAGVWPILAVAQAWLR
jgi:hypothetical protein